jgi:IQ motif/SEC7 domain-containing protein
MSFDATSFFHTDYPYCIRLSQKVDGKVIITFNARNQHDQLKFADDLRESIAEMDEMEAIRIEIELERQARCIGNGLNNNLENRDSGFVGDIDPQYSPKSQTSHSVSNNDPQYGQLKRGGALSNSLLDIHDQCKEMIFSFDIFSRFISFLSSI